jgi:2-keto-4-pentenoate hydratase/2-oxohepta-3-ene-1,7-dioic acid hydratase in catechol pathway
MRLGVVDGRAVLVMGDRSLDIERASEGRFDHDPTLAFTRWDELVAWSSTAVAEGELLSPTSLQNPVPNARQVFGVGANYSDHVAEAGGDTPATPLIFTKFPTCLSGPLDKIPLPSRKVDWEAELVVVIGSRAHYVSEKDAWAHVAALTVGQDVSERVVQLSGPHAQFSMGKSYPGFGPLGPVLVTPDEFVDPDDLSIGCAVNGEVMQSGRTGNMIFSVADLIARLSAVCPLLPGDLIFTGTPAGVGVFRSPRIFLRPGDVLTTWIENVGELRNEVVAGPGYVPPSEGRR